MREDKIRERRIYGVRYVMWQLEGASKRARRAMLRVRKAARHGARQFMKKLMEEDGE